jgi:hypothetical protein
MQLYMSVPGTHFVLGLAGRADSAQGQVGRCNGDRSNGTMHALVVPCVRRARAVSHGSGLVVAGLVKMHH